MLLKFCGERPRSWEAEVSRAERMTREGGVTRRFEESEWRQRGIVCRRDFRCGRRWTSRLRLTVRRAAARLRAIRMTRESELRARLQICALRVVTCLTILALCGFSLTNPAAAGLKAPAQVIIDTDPGTDDALAILLALNSPEIEVRALTVVPGNVTGKQGLENALKIVSLAGRCDIPVAGGAQHPLFQKLITAEFWHGANGLANVELPASKCKADTRWAPDLIIEMVHAAPHEITLVPVGPLTNIALAVEKDPSIVPLVKEVVIMGGSITGGNVNASAEANIYGDPEAAQIVFQAGWPLTMVGSDVGERTLFGTKQVEELSKTHGPENDFAVAVLKYLVALSQKFGVDGTAMYDPLAVGAAIDRSVIQTQPMHVDVETRGQFTRGETVANRRNAIERNVPHEDRLWIESLDPVPPNVQVAVGSNAEKFAELFISRIRGK